MGRDYSLSPLVRLLAVETATEACSAALADGARVLERTLIAPQAHAARILPMVAELLEEAGWALTAVDAIAFGRGPGAFTGVRIAAGVAQGLALAADLPVVPVSSLAALAHGARRKHDRTTVIAAIDARMDEVYLAAFRVDPGSAQPAGAEHVGDPDVVPLPEGGTWLGAGSGWASHGERLAARLGSRLAAYDGALLPQARDVAALARPAFEAGAAVPAELALPVYLRDRVTG